MQTVERDGKETRKTLDEHKRRFVEGNMCYVRWVYHCYLSRGLVHTAVMVMGSEADVIQMLFLEFCRIIESTNGELKRIPPFVKNQLAVFIRDKVNLKRESIKYISFDECLLEDGENSYLLMDPNGGEMSNQLEVLDEYNHAMKYINEAAEPTKTMIMRYFFGGLSYAEIALDYGITGEAVGSRIRLWLKLVREQLSTSKEHHNGRRA